MRWGSGSGQNPPGRYGWSGFDLRAQAQQRLDHVGGAIRRAAGAKELRHGIQVVAHGDQGWLDKPSLRSAGSRHWLQCVAQAFATYRLLDFAALGQVLATGSAAQTVAERTIRGLA